MREGSKQEDLADEYKQREYYALGLLYNYKDDEEVFRYYTASALRKAIEVDSANKFSTFIS